MAWDASCTRRMLLRGSDFRFREHIAKEITGFHDRLQLPKTSRPAQI